MKRVLSSGAGLLLIALAFLAFNMVSGLLFSGARLDLTEQKLYTISPGTKRILAGLDEPINLYFFYSDSGARELVPLRNYARRVEELLRAYEREANGRIRLQVIDPEPFSENEDKATEFGLQGISLQQGGDNLYFGLAGSNALDGVQVIPFFPPRSGGVPRIRHQPPGADPGTAAAAGGRPDVVAAAQWRLRHGQPAADLAVDGHGGNPPAIRPAQPQERCHGNPAGGLGAAAGASQAVTRADAIRHRPVRPARGKLLAFVDPFSEADSGSDFAATLDGDKSSDLAPLFEAWGCACCRARCSVTAPMRCPSVLAGTSVRPGIRPGSACRARRWTRTTSPLPAWKA